MEVTMKGSPAKLKGNQPIIGVKAPEFNLENLDGKMISLEKLKGNKVLLSVFPDITTSVCDAQTRHFFEAADDYDDLTIINISNNTKDQLKDWCATNNIDVEMLSDKDLNFADAYGLYIPDFDILARAVFLIDEDGLLAYKEVLEELTDEPDYDAVFAAVDKLS